MIKPSTIFQRLNAGGTPANAQELRNCIILMINADYFRAIKKAAESEPFQIVTSLTEDQIERRRHIELAFRFLVHTYIKYDGVLDVEEYIDEGSATLAQAGKSSEATAAINATFELLSAVEGKDALRRYEGGVHSGKVGLVGLEGIAVGIAKNIKAIKALADPEKFVRKKIREFWSHPETANLTSPGLRGTLRIKKTVPFGQEWFRP